MPVAEPPCAACCYAFTDTPCGSCYTSCSDGRADLAAWLTLPEVVARAVLGLAVTAAADGSPERSASTRLALRLIEGYLVRDVTEILTVAVRPSVRASGRRRPGSAGRRGGNGRW